jgi:hypothetical protein
MLVRIPDLCWLGLLVGLGGCTHYNYSPNMVATPFIDQPKTGSIGVGLGGFFHSLSVDAQAAYNPWKRVTVTTSYFLYRNRFSETSAPTDFQRNQVQHVEGALGGWLPFEHSRLRYGLFLGGGAGDVRNRYLTQKFVHLKYSRFFAQPCLTFKSNWFRLGMGVKVSRLTYGSGRVDVSIPEADLMALEKLDADGPYWLFETGINAGFTIKPVTLLFSYTQIRMEQGKNYQDYLFDPLNFTWGLSVDLDVFRRKKSQNSPRSIE